MAVLSQAAQAAGSDGATATGCRADGLVRGMPAPGRSALLAGVFPVLGIPVYLFRTRPWRRALLATLGAAAFLVMGLVLAAVGTLSIEFIRS